MGKYCAANDVVRCDQCDYIAVSTEVAKQHKLIVHTKKVECGKDFSCDKCNYTSARKADFKRHVRKVHNQIKTVSQHTSRTPMFSCDSISNKLLVTIIDRSRFRHY